MGTSIQGRGSLTREADGSGAEELVLPGDHWGAGAATGETDGHGGLLGVYFVEMGGAVISDSDLKEILPKAPSPVPPSSQVQSGIPVPKAKRVTIFSPDEWEEFIEAASQDLVDERR